MKQKNDPLVIGLAGLGTVGSGLLDTIALNKDWCARRTGREITVKTVADLDTAKAARVEEMGASFSTDALSMLDDPDIQVVVELMGGTGFAKTFIIKALEKGKHVVTANKALLAEHGHEIFPLALEKNLHLGFEASVAGAIPVVQTIKETLAGNRVDKLRGILNGTANFIITHMSETGMAFDDALKLAQDKGYAEADPTLDVEGVDAAHKLVLLIRLAFGKYYPLEKLPITGIRVVTPMDIGYAAALGYKIRLLAMARRVNGKIEAGIFPGLIAHDQLLASVSGSFNAVLLDGNGGPIMLYGYGAGDLPTGSAVLSDIATIARGAEPNNTGFVDAAQDPVDILDLDEAVTKHYLRFQVHDRPGVLRDISGVLADHDISLAQVIQKDEIEGLGVPLVFLTHEAKARAIHDSMDILEKSDLCLTRAMHYRIF